MQITNANQLLELENNHFYGELPNLINSTINFNGNDNILVCEKGVTLRNSRIDFHLNNSILYLSSNKNHYFVTIALNKNSVCYIGKNNYLNGHITIVCSEAKNVIIGDDCLFSYGVIIRVSDAHAIYSTDTQNRVNHAKSIYIGDHVWIGQNTMIFKGTQISSGAIIGAGSVLSNKIVPSNTTFAGNPAKLVKEKTFWIPHSTHSWGKEENEKMNLYKNQIFTYEHDETSLNFNEIEEIFLNSNADESLDYIKNNFLNNAKNRFASNISKTRRFI